MGSSLEVSIGRQDAARIARNKYIFFMDVVLEKSFCVRAGKYTNTKEGIVLKMSQKLGSMVEMFLILFQTAHEWKKPIGK
jgi:hypothetical protein